MEKIRIRDVYPGSATLKKSKIKKTFWENSDRDPEQATGSGFK
jgi:hypothetical protein